MRVATRRCCILVVGTVALSVFYTIQLLFEEDIPDKKWKEMRTQGTIPKGTITIRNGIERNNSEANVYRWHHGKWLRIPSFCSNYNNFSYATLKTSVGNMKMYIHDVASDVHVSGSLKRTGMWDSVGVYTMIARLKRDPEMGLIDIGSQLGTFSLVASMMDRHVIAVDPLVENVLRMCKTIQDAKMSSKFTILFTAISDKRTVASFRRLQNNLGGTHILQAGEKEKPLEDNYNANYVNTVLLDDIVPFIHFQKAFIKIDVEGHEYEALKEGRQLFRNVMVRGILMEWFQVRTTKKGFNLKNLLYDLDFRAEDPLTRGQLNQAKAMTWPPDILWLKKDTYDVVKKVALVSS